MRDVLKLSIPSFVCCEIPSARGDSLLLEMKNRTRISGREENPFCTLQLKENSPSSPSLVWSETFHGVNGTCVSGCMSFSAISLSNSSLHVFTCAGRRALPPIDLPSPCVSMAISGNNQILAVITRSAHVFVWDVSSSTCLVREECHPVIHELCNQEFSKQPNVELRMTQEGWPIVYLDEEKIHLYHFSLKTWLNIGSAHYQNSAFYSTIGARKCSGVSLTLSHGVERNGNEGNENDLLSSLQRVQGPPSLDQTVLPQDGNEDQTITHLEHQLASSYVLKSEKEYERWLSLYLHHLCRIGAKRKLQELCDSFLIKNDSLLFTFAQKNEEKENENEEGKERLKKVIGMMRKSNHQHLHRLAARYELDIGEM